jgi:hypothetical protein
MDTRTRKLILLRPRVQLMTLRRLLTDHSTFDSDLRRDRNGQGDEAESIEGSRKGGGGRSRDEVSKQCNRCEQDVTERRPVS